MQPYHFTVPEQKKVRLIIHTDCKNEADDQFAVVQQLLTPYLDVKAIIAGHFEVAQDRYPAGKTVDASYEEILRLLDLMALNGQYPVLRGASASMPDEHTPLPSEAAEFIVQEAMRDDPRPLYIGMQGAITDLAAAILIEPRICERMTAIWIGGGDYPDGGYEFNLMQDIAAANVVFSSKMPLWQVTQGVYKQFAVTLSELQIKVRPYGKVGRYLFQQMADLNVAFADKEWPHGETWALGDHGVIAALMQEQQKCDNYTMRPAPNVDPENMRYVYSRKNRDIRVYQTMDARVTLEDMFAKLQIHYPRQDSYPSARQVAEAHLTRLTNLLDNTSQGHYSKEKAVEFRDAARHSIGSVMPAKSMELQHTIRLIHEMTAEIDEVEAEIKRIMDELAPPILTIKGISYCMGAMILDEIGDYSRFDSPDKVLAYAGLSPSTYQSGQLNGAYAHMEKRGSRYLRYALFNAAKYVCRWDPTFAAYLAKKRAEGKHYNVAVSHAAKKLVRVIFAIQNSGEAYRSAA